MYTFLLLLLFLLKTAMRSRLLMRYGAIEMTAIIIIIITTLSFIVGRLMAVFVQPSSPSFFLCSLAESFPFKLSSSSVTPGPPSPPPPPHTHTHKHTILQSSRHHHRKYKEQQTIVIIVIFNIRIFSFTFLHPMGRNRELMALYNIISTY